MSPVSPFVPSLSLRADAERRLRQTYIDLVVKKFFAARGIEEKVREVTPSQAITELDFRESRDLPFSYIYDVVMAGVKKQDGRVSHVAYTLTFDPALCPHVCETTNTRYGHLTLADRPVLYYILLDLPTLIARIRQHSDLKPSYTQ